MKMYTLVNKSVSNNFDLKRIENEICSIYEKVCNLKVTVHKGFYIVHGNITNAQARNVGREIEEGGKEYDLYKRK